MAEIPLPIPGLVLENIPDEMGFTMPEKIALRNAWKILSPDLHVHARDFFLSFFTENESFLNRFRDQNDEIMMNESHGHSITIFHTLEEMIFEGLNGVLQMHGIISPVVMQHTKVGITHGEISVMSESMAQYLKAVLQRVLAPTLERSIDKICQLITMAHRQ